ncbi:MAG: hypothetical protein BGO88_02990 [Flavobacterium sp. 38-13]|uniref:LytTR family DNA-binding domain-containing protein n=1 Tax=Flavobacterium sp. 38-13 TaxID=1896168 RepID=UPI000968BA6F|nr:LytTR family DNA-binding domain-containing protein [Flavobacterium sp. 38-13]OJX54855.1 MAG: hypothetical protein BGO88_02990 [Flavobacterium sp. 38-13]
MESVSYNNRRLRLLSAAIASIYIVFHGIPVDLVRAFSSPAFYVAVAVSFTISLLLVNTVHTVTVWLDKRCPWRLRPFERGGLQLIFGVVVPALIDLLLVSVYFGFLGESVMENGFLLIDFPVIICLIIFLNLYYLIHYLLLTEGKPLEDRAKGYPLFSLAKGDDKGTLPTSLNIHYNGQHLFFNVENDIMFFYREGKRVKCTTFHGNRYPVNASISDLEERFTGTRLCRISRSTIINYKMVKGYNAGTKRNTAELIIRPDYQPYIKDWQSHEFVVTKEFLKQFKEGLQEL